GSGNRTGNGQGRAQAGQSGQNGGNGQFAGFGAAGANPTRGFVVTLQNGKLTLVPVSLGLTDGSVTEITGGLKGGETIVTGATGVSTSTARSTNGTGGQRSPVGGGGPNVIFAGRGG
ncbi:MAG TPA: hypothetical protein VFZ25_09070, partial [Chloroflexota bacterium]|nr:hypothetical protein [Chloroflexota bacterium]